MTEFIKEYDGKVVWSIEVGETYIVITFTDGSTLEATAKGSEEQWLEIEKNA